MKTLERALIGERLMILMRVADQTKEVEWIAVALKTTIPNLLGGYHVNTSTKPDSGRTHPLATNLMS